MFLHSSKHVLAHYYKTLDCSSDCSHIHQTLKIMCQYCLDDSVKYLFTVLFHIGENWKKWNIVHFETCGCKLVDDEFELKFEELLNVTIQ